MANRTTTERGLGWKHQQETVALHRQHIDGSPCWWCDKPMFAEPERNWDSKKLAADHSHSRARGGTKADRLLHDTCNKQRGDGSRDDQRPAVTGVPIFASTDDGRGHRAMPWPI